MNTKSWLTPLSLGCILAGCGQAGADRSASGDDDAVTPPSTNEPATNEPAINGPATNESSPLPEEPTVVEGAPVEGQSGSEVVETTPAAQEYLDCPCERLRGATAYVGTVISWESILLTLQVSDVPPSAEGPEVPGVGQIVKGAYAGQMACYSGDYLPSPGDLVVAFVLSDEAIPRFCCGHVDCAEQCNSESDTDSCLVDCQALATPICAEERSEATAVWVVAPLGSDGMLNLGYDEDEEFSVSLEDLPVVFQGGEQCRSSLGSVDQVLDGLGGPIPWAESCPALGAE